MRRLWNLSYIVGLVAIGLMSAFSPALAQVPEHAWIQGEPPVRLTRQARYFVMAETQSNPIASRSSRPFKISHLEIPLELVQKDIGLGLDPRILASMVFTKDGIEYVRWILNPEDTRFNEELRLKLNEEDIPFTEGRHYIGYLTSSRSCIIQDPDSGIIFSIKSSTNQTAGNWREKRESVRAAKLGRMVSDYLQRNDHSNRHKELGVVKEPLSFGFGPADQAIIVRQYDNFNEIDGNYLVPLFSVFHEDFGRDLAEDNGARDPEKYWFKILGKKRFAKVIVKLALNYGIIFNSPHGQNFLVEIDSRRNPTGRIFIRDYADANFWEPVLKAQGGRPILKLIKDFEINYASKSEIELGFNPFYSGNVVTPTWIESEKIWKKAFTKSATALFKKWMSVGKDESGPDFHKNLDQWHSYWSVGINDVDVAPGYDSWLKKLQKEHAKNARRCETAIL